MVQVKGFFCQIFWQANILQSPACKWKLIQMIKSLNLGKFCREQSPFPARKVNRKAFFSHSKRVSACRTKYLCLSCKSVWVSFKVRKGLLSLKHDKVFPKVTAAASSVLGATGSRQCNCMDFLRAAFPLSSSSQSCGYELAFFTRFVYVLRSCFSGLKGKQRSPWCSCQISITPGLHWAPSNSRCHHWDQVQHLAELT